MFKAKTLVLLLGLLLVVGLLVPRAECSTEGDGVAQEPTREMPQELDDEETDMEPRGSKPKLGLFNWLKSDPLKNLADGTGDMDDATIRFIEEKMDKIRVLYSRQKDYPRTIKKINEYLKRYDETARETNQPRVLAFILWLMKTANQSYRKLDLYVPALLQANEALNFAKSKLGEKEVEAANELLDSTRQQLVRIFDDKGQTISLLSFNNKGAELKALLKELSNLVPEKNNHLLDETSQETLNNLRESIKVYRESYDNRGKLL